MLASLVKIDLGPFLFSLLQTPLAGSEEGQVVVTVKSHETGIAFLDPVDFFLFITADPAGGVVFPPARKELLHRTRP